MIPTWIIFFRLLVFALAAAAFTAFGRGHGVLGWILLAIAAALIVTSFVIHFIGRLHHAVDVIDSTPIPTEKTK